MSHIKINNPTPPQHPKWLLWATFAVSTLSLVVSMVR